MDHSKSRPPLTVQEFLSIIRGDPRPEATARFVAAIRGDGLARPDEPLAEDHRPAQHVSHEDWLNAVLYGIHGPTHPDFPGNFREHNFNPAEPRDDKGRWTTGGAAGGAGSASAGTAATTAAAKAPLPKPPPKYEPGKWNDDAKVKESNNCYSYALDRPNLPDGKPRPPGKPQPGEAAGHPLKDGHYDTDLNAAAKRDVYGVKDLGADGKCPPGYHKIQAFYDPSGGGDYHWYRQDADGTWSQKHGNGEATNKDADDKVITDPMKANRDHGPGLNYSKACPVLIAPN